MKKPEFLLLSVPILFLILLAMPAQSQTEAPLNVSWFKSPPAEFRGIRWAGYGLSNLTDSSAIKSIRTGVASRSWGSTLLGPARGPTTGLSDAYLKASKRAPSDVGVVYLSDEYFRIYKLAIQEGLKYNFPVSTIYDEWDYPSGIVAGQFFSKYPQLTGKSIELIEKNSVGPGKAEVTVPQGIYIGAVLMNMETHQRIDVSKQKTSANIVSCKIPKGSWKLMAFYLKSEFRPASSKGGAVDYLDKSAVAKYIQMNFEPYYTHLKEYFGTVIKRTFYDEPSMHLVDGRMWTASFNKEFEKKYNYSPMTLYPALWYNIGPETAAARNALFGFNASLFSNNYIGQVAAWCEAHGIKMAGHLDQEEARNPVAINGDMMKVFKHQQIPGHDDIYYPGRSNSSYKLITSAAYNYDRPECIAETYAAYRTMNPTIAMRTAVDQLAMGINMQLAVTGKSPEMDEFLGRSCYLLRGGRHIADIAVMYPIESLQSAYSFNSAAKASRGGTPGMYYALEGGLVPPETDYMDLGEMLFRSMRIDYTFLHPEVLVEKGVVENNNLVLNNKENREQFKVLVIPGGDTFSAEAAKKVLEFYRKGGTVIATSKLPTRSAEFKRDIEIRDMVYEVFGISDENAMTAEITIMADEFTSYFKNTNAAGGRGYFVPKPILKVVTAVLKEALPVKDVDIQEAPLWPLKTGTAYDGSLTYTHKFKGGKNVYFFANSGDTPMNTNVAFRGVKSLEIWNPHTGEMKAAELTKTEVGGQTVTTAKLSLPPVSGLFFLGE